MLNKKQEQEQRAARNEAILNKLKRSSSAGQVKDKENQSARWIASERGWIIITERTADWRLADIERQMRNKFGRKITKRKNYPQLKEV